MTLGVGPAQLAPERGVDQSLHRRDRRAGRHRVGGVGDHQHGGPVASPHVALEARRNLDAELRIARPDQLVELLGIAHLPAEIEIVGVLHRRQHGAGQRAVVAHQHRRRQLLGVGVDGVAEQSELQDRHEDHGGEGHAVAPHLHELLDHHRPHAPEEAGIVLGRAVIARRRSCEIVLGLVHQAG